MKKYKNNKKKKKDKNYYLQQDCLQAFFKEKKKALAIHVLKGIKDIKAIRDVQKCIRCYVPNIQKDIEGCLFPKDFEELCSTLITFVRPKSLNSEILWFCSYFNHYKEIIRWFLIQKESFEKKLLLGLFSECFAILSNVKEKIGVSLWYYESMFLLYEYWDKRKEGILLMSNCLDSTCNKDVNHLQALVYRLHQRATINISPYKFDEDLDSLYKQNKTLLHEDYYKYVLFRLNFFNNIDQQELSFNLMFESLSALIDRYLMVINTLKSAAVTNCLDKDLQSRVRYLYSKTSDKELLPIIASCPQKMQTDYYDYSFIQILDNYYKGDYEETIELCRSYVEKDTSQFDVLVIYCRSLIYKGDLYCNIYPIVNAPINKLCHQIYRVLVDAGNKEIVYSLYQMNKNFYGFHIAAHMHVFVKTEMNEPVNARIKSFWCNLFDPNYAKTIFSNTNDFNNYLRYYPHFSSSIVCQVAKAKLKKEKLDEKQSNYNVAIPHNAMLLMSEGNYDEAFNLWEGYYNSSSRWLPNRQKAVRNMIECLFRANKIGQSISLYVNYLLSDKAATIKVDTDSIIKQLQDNLYEGVRRNIDLAIFMGLNSKDGVDKSFILFEFCEIKGVELPSELIDNLDDPIERQEVFFAILNDDETLRHYFNIPSLKDRLNERLKIVNYLVSLNTHNKDVYYQFQKEIEDALLVYRVSKNLNEGKIYANDQAILKYKLKELDGLYKRFMQLFDMVINDKSRILVINFLDTTVLFTDKGYEAENVKSKTSISENGIYEVFYSLYDYILDKFLYSEFGLVAYLSTRVRHGELESKLRPELAQRNLILSMKDNVYQETSYWKDHFNLNNSENAIVNTALKKFSSEFDKEIVTLIKEKLQIYDKEKKPYGLFNYKTDENELAVKAMEIGLLAKKKGIDEFCRQILTWLWQKTDCSLTNIRNYISGEFTARINVLIDTLKTDLSPDVLPSGHIQNFLQAAIADASSVLASRLKTIECWFNITGSKLEDADLRQLTYQVYNNIVAAYPQIKLSGKPQMEGDSFKIKSTYVLHYADLLRNLMTNMFKHGNVDENGIKKVVLKFIISKDVLELHFENEVERGSENLLNQKFTEKLQGKASYFNSEGGSGIAKAHKILRADLQCDDNKLNMLASNGKCITEALIYTSQLKVDE